MADTTFTPGTVITSAWLNDVNNAVYRGASITNNNALNVKNYPYNATGDGVTDDTLAIKAALAASNDIYIPSGTYKITDKLSLNSGHNIQLASGVTIQQYTANTEIFYGFQKENITLDCNGAILYGEGTWSAAWTGNGGHNDRAFHFIDCDRIIIKNPHTKNCGHSGIALVGSTRVHIVLPILEGTNLYSTPIPLAGNFQCGIYMYHHPTYGACDAINVISPDISGTAQGVLVELEVGAAQPVIGNVFVSPVVHDITGQHAFYITSGGLSISSPTMMDIALSGIKIQAGTANQNIKGITVTGAVGITLGSQLYEIAVPSPYTGIISGIKVDGVATNCFRGLSIARQVQNLQAEIVVDTCTDAAVQLNGASLSDIDIKLTARNCGTDGVVCYATNSQDIRIYPTIRNPNTSNNSTACGIRVESASATLDIFDPDISDSNTRMKYGLFNSIAGSTVRVRGSAKFTGAADTAVRSTGIIAEWPTDVTLSGVNGNYTSMSNIKSKQPMSVTARSTSASNVSLWNQTLDDESTYLVSVRMTGKLLDSSQRRGLVFTGVFYRDAGGIATIQGAVDVDVDVASGSFAGVYSLASNGANDVVLLVNSGGAATYDWSALVTTVKIS